MVSSSRATPIAITFIASLALGFSAPSLSAQSTPSASVVASNPVTGSVTFGFDDVSDAGLSGTITIIAGGVATQYPFTVTPGETIKIALPPAAIEDPNAKWIVKTGAHGEIGSGGLW